MLPHLGQPVYVDYKGKYNSLQFGTIIEIISPGLVRVKFQDKSIREIPSKLAHPLLIPELGGCFSNKPSPPLPNGKINQASQDIVNLIKREKGLTIGADWMLWWNGIELPIVNECVFFPETCAIL